MLVKHQRVADAPISHFVVSLHKRQIQVGVYLHIIVLFGVLSSLQFNTISFNNPSIIFHFFPLVSDLFLHSVHHSI